jgi:hypothetical protein
MYNIVVTLITLLYGCSKLYGFWFFCSHFFMSGSDLVEIKISNYLALSLMISHDTIFWQFWVCISYRWNFLKSIFLYRTTIWPCLDRQFQKYLTSPGTPIINPPEAEFFIYGWIKFFFPESSETSEIFYLKSFNQIQIKSKQSKTISFWTRL